MERATDVLTGEHRGIERMLRIMEVAVERLEHGEQVPADVFERSADFIRGFADKCHHAKEEKNLFPLLERRGIPRQGPIGVMLAEHAEGRRYAGGFADAISGHERGDEAARQAVIDNAKAYIGLLRAHILKEDHVLFPMADKALSDTDQSDLAERFEQVEAEEIGEGVHERYHGMIGELERALGIAG